MTRNDLPVVLIVDGDDADFDRTCLAMKEAHIQNAVRRVRTGEELLDYLRRRGKYIDARTSPTPVMILLDLEVPGGDGREALREIRTDPALKRFPVVVLTKSVVDGDMARAYELGAKSFMAKPVSFQGLVQSLSALGRCWMEIVESAPPRPTSPSRIVH